MKSNLFNILLLIISTSIFSCSSSSEIDNNKRKEAKGGRKYGGIFKLAESEYIQNLHPLSIVGAYSYRIATQIYEGLFKYDQETLDIVPAIAENYKISEDGKTYTITLRKDVYFHDDNCFLGEKGRLLTAEDVAYSVKQACTSSRFNKSFHIYQDVLLGANEYYQNSKNNTDNAIELPGIKIINTHTIEFTLLQPSSKFIHNLAGPNAFIFPKEAVETYGETFTHHPVGTGPFSLANLEEDIQIDLVRNNNYYKKDEFGNQLPFLDGISSVIYGRKNYEYLDFKSKQLHMIYKIPIESIMEVLENEKPADDGETFGDYKLQYTAELSTQMLSLMNGGNIFKNPNIRKAFSFAINRQSLVELVMNNSVYSTGNHGVTPPEFKQDYDIRQIQGYSYNKDSAVYYFRKAGYQSGKDFPPIKLYFNKEGNRQKAIVMQIRNQLKRTLGIEIEPENVSHAEMVDKSLFGKYNFLRLAWIGDYPSPEAFLWMFYSKNIPSEKGEKSYPNISRYSNKNFDNLYEKGLQATTQAEAMKYYLQAEQLLMKDAPVIVLWYDQGYRMLQSNVKNFPTNAMQYRDFSEVYLEETKPLKK